jgi:hypothetical protein
MKTMMVSHVHAARMFALGKFAVLLLGAPVAAAFSSSTW